MEIKKLRFHPKPWLSLKKFLATGPFQQFSNAAWGVMVQPILLSVRILPVGEKAKRENDGDESDQGPQDVNVDSNVQNIARQLFQ